MRTPTGRSLIALLAGLALVAPLLGGCGGGIGSTTPPPTTTATVIVEALIAGTTTSLPVPATIVIGGVTGVTDLAQGYVIITGVPLGSSDPPQQPLTATAPGYVTVSQTVTLTTSSYTTVSVEMAPADPTQTATIQGSVTSTPGAAPVANALVSFTPDGSSTAVSGFTDKAGHYKFGGVPIGVVTALAQGAGYLEDRHQVTLQADSTGTNPAVNFSLLSGSTRVPVAGFILRLGLETPVAGARVTLGDQPAVTTGANGQFSVANVQVGSRPVTVTASGYDDLQQTLEITPGMGPITLYLAPSSPNPPGKPYTITGRVTLPGHPDNSGAIVSAFSQALGQVVDSDTTNAAGDYYLFVAPGTYRITAQYGTHSIGRDVILLGGGRVLTGVNFTLTAP